MFCGAVERADGWSGCEEVWEKAGITDGSRFLACYHVGGGPFPKQGKLGEDQVGTVLAVPGLTAQRPWFQARKTEAPAFPVGTTGKNVEQTGPEKGHVATERGRSQGHRITVTAAAPCRARGSTDTPLDSHHVPALSQFLPSDLPIPVACFMFLQSDDHHQNVHALLLHCLPAHGPYRLSARGSEDCPSCSIMLCPVLRTVAAAASDRYVYVQVVPPGNVFTHVEYL